jgi:hypothetical protein
MKRSNLTGHPTNTVGRYRGVDYVTHRLCDVFPHWSSRKWNIFEYDDHEATGNHFKTLAEFKQWVDSDGE